MTAIDRADRLLAAGATLVTLAINGPRYDLSAVPEWLDWRDARNA